MFPICAALFLTLLPARPDSELVRVDWSRVSPADTEVAALRTVYASAVNTGDIARASELYSSDALAMLDDGMVRGAEAIGRRLAGITSGASVTLMPQRFTSAATVASETGTFTETLPGPDGVRSVEGVYVTIYSRNPSGHWRIALEVRTTGRWPALAVW